MSSKDTSVSIVKSLVGIIAIAVAAEFLIMVLWGQMGFVPRSLALYLASAAILGLVIAPPVFLLILYPLKRAYESGAQRGLSVYDNELLTPNLDPLTQVLSKQAITVNLLEAVAQADRYGNRLSVAMADVDQLQRINKDYSKDAGDRVLQSVAAMLTDALRMPDRIGRYTGQDFLIILPETTGDDATKLADRIRATVSETPVPYNSTDIDATISFGITQFHKGEDISHLLSRVEQAIVEAKKKGSNLVINK